MRSSEIPRSKRRWTVAAVLGGCYVASSEWSACRGMAGLEPAGRWSVLRTSSSLSRSLRYASPTGADHLIDGREGVE